MSKIIVNGAYINLSEVAKLKNIEDLKVLEIFSDNADEANKAVWDKAQEIKAKPVEPVKVKITKDKTGNK